MEPFDYPNNDPGPQTLLTSLDRRAEHRPAAMADEPRSRAMSGSIGYMGARFTATEQALSPVLRETAKRGLIYVDDGSSPRSVAGADRRQPATCPSPRPTSSSTRCRRRVEIDRALARLEMAAREHGSAVGIANALPATIDAHRRLGEGRGRPRLRAGADHHGGGEGEIDRNVIVARDRSAR